MVVEGTAPHQYHAVTGGGQPANWLLVDCGPDKGPSNRLTAVAARRKRLALTQRDFGLRVATAPVDTGCFALVASGRHGSHLLSDVWGLQREDSPPVQIGRNGKPPGKVHFRHRCNYSAVITLPGIGCASQEQQRGDIFVLNFTDSQRVGIPGAMAIFTNKWALSGSEFNVSQCLSAGTLLPDRIAEAVDLATPQASMILDGRTFCSPGRINSRNSSGSPRSP
jgi:hypothetical protein